jgi:hypothetical protein
MNSSASTIRVSGLAKAKLAALRQQASTLGMSAEDYARHLIEDGISLDIQARTKTFDELYAPAQARFRKSGMTEAELDKLVDEAPVRHRRSGPRTKAGRA